MNKNNILFATNLNVWSIKKGVGAPSFYNTLKLYNDNADKVFLFTTEKTPPLEELANVEVVRIPKLKEFNVKYIYFLNRVFNYILYQLIFIYFYLSKQKKKVDLLYGYEIEFIPSLYLISRIKNIPLVSRFQGTILCPKMKKILWQLKYLPHFLSIKIRTNLTIMADDGTKGDLVIKEIRGDLENVLFLKNGVDFKKYDLNNVSEEVKKIVHEIKLFEYNFVSVSRLQKWKRVDRSLDVFNLFQKEKSNSRYVVIGDGDTKEFLEEYVQNKNIKNIIFTGGLNSDEVNFLLNKSDIFLSHYELSNVGNPLWEAINNKCLVVTLNNGDTGSIINDSLNGIISDEKDYLLNAEKLLRNIKSKENFNKMTCNATITLNSNVKSWDERMEIEYGKIKAL